MEYYYFARRLYNEFQIAIWRVNARRLYNDHPNQWFREPVNDATLLTSLWRVILIRGGGKNGQIEKLRRDWIERWPWADGSVGTPSVFVWIEKLLFPISGRLYTQY